MMGPQMGHRKLTLKINFGVNRQGSGSSNTMLEESRDFKRIEKKSEFKAELES